MRWPRRSRGRTGRRGLLRWTSPLRRIVGASALVILLFASPEAVAQTKLDWETGAGKSYVIPALEVGGFIFGLNQVNRRLFKEDNDYNTDAETIWRNLGTKPVFDSDPFSINQIGHPYQGGIYTAWPARRV